MRSTSRASSGNSALGGTIMRHARRLRFELAVSIAILAISGADARAQASYPPPNDLPNPYRTVLNWAQLPDGRKWGSTSGVAIGPEGNFCTYDRCGGNSWPDQTPVHTPS